MNDKKEIYLVYELHEHELYPWETLMSAFDDMDDARKYVEEVAHEVLSEDIKEMGKRKPHLMLEHHERHLERLKEMEYRWSKDIKNKYLPYVGDNCYAAYTSYKVRIIKLNNRYSKEEIKEREING